MSDQKEFDQEITPFHEHAIAFGVILLFGAMYLFFMQGCQPLNAMFGSGSGGAGHLESDSRLAAVSAGTGVVATASAFDANAKNDSSDAEKEGTEAEGVQEPQSVAELDGEQTASSESQAGTANNALAPSGQAQSAMQASQAAEQAKQIQATAEKQRAAAVIAKKQAELEAARRAKADLEAQLAAAKQAESQALLAAQQASANQTTDKANEPAPVPQQAVANQAQQSPQQTRPQVSGNVLMLPDGRGVQISKDGFESQFWRAAVQNSPTTVIFDRVYFVSGSDELNPDSTDQILSVAAVLNTYKDVRVRLRGHTDNQGQDEANLPLSLSRSLSVKRRLVDLGIDDSRISVEGMGASEPIAGNDTESGRAKNRRIDLTIVR